MSGAAIERWIARHSPCADAAEWLRSQPSMAAAWRNCTRSDWMLFAMDRGGVGSARELRLFATWCARRVAPFNPDPYVMAVIKAAEAFAWGESDVATMNAARAAAWVARDVARGAAGDAAWCAAWAAGDAPWDAMVAAGTAARVARDATKAAAGDAAMAAEQAAQADELRRRFRWRARGAR